MHIDVYSSYLMQDQITGLQQTIKVSKAEQDQCRKQRAHSHWTGRIYSCCHILHNISLVVPVTPAYPMFFFHFFMTQVAFNVVCGLTQVFKAFCNFYHCQWTNDLAFVWVDSLCWWKDMAKTPGIKSLEASECKDWKLDYWFININILEWQNAASLHWPELETWKLEIK